jgi:hypothetical protein
MFGFVLTLNASPIALSSIPSLSLGESPYFFTFIKLTSKTQGTPVAISEITA